jgi:hypothetical protein
MTEAASIPGGAATLIDEVAGVGFGWVAPTPAFMRRASHAILSGGGVWYTDPVYDPLMLQRGRTLGPAKGVVQLLDRHPRDCARVAQELGVPLYVLPRSAPQGAPFEIIRVIRSGLGRWHEVALWFPRERLLCVAEAIGGAPYFLAPGEVVGPHPILRLVHPPRSLCGIPAAHVVCGHGPGLHATDAGAQMDAAIRHARRRIPRWVLAMAGVGRHRSRALPKRGQPGA